MNDANDANENLCGCGKKMHCRDHRLHKAVTKLTLSPFILVGLPSHTEDPEPPQLASGIVIEPTGRNSFVTKELTMAMIATLADAGSEMALQVPVSTTTDFVLTGV
jgi:hypothetical protein